MRAPCDRQRKEQARVSQRIVIEVVAALGVEMIGVQRPAAQGNGEPYLVLFVALAMKRRETEALAEGEVEQRAGHRGKWRRLVVASVETAQDPVQDRQSQRGPEARVRPRFPPRSPGNGKAARRR